MGYVRFIEGCWVFHGCISGYVKVLMMKFKSIFMRTVFGFTEVL